MKPILSIIILFSYYISFGQKAIIEPNETATLKDSSTNSTYILDKEHKHITAYDSTGKKLWSFFTTISSVYRGKYEEPIEISFMELTTMPLSYSNENLKEGDRTILIYHTNCAGWIRLTDGEYFLSGCD